jgi:hypothetical protein
MDMRKTKRVLISLLTLIGLGLIFSSATYAWITLSTINNIEGLSLTASAGDDLELSLDGENYYNQLPGELVEALFENMRLVDVTSLDGINFETGGLRDKGVAVANEHYISFDLWIRTTRPEHNIYLINHIDSMSDFNTEEIGTYAISEGVLWVAKSGFFNGPSVDDWVEAGDIDRYYASQAVRMSFIELPDDLNTQDVRNPNDLNRFVFDPSNNPYRGYGITYGAFSYFFQRTRWWITAPTIIPEVSYRLTELDPNDPYQALDNESLIAELQPTGIIGEKDREYYSSKVRINIWIEGWDADAFDSIDKDRIKFQIQFKAARPPMIG